MTELAEDFPPPEGFHTVQSMAAMIMASFKTTIDAQPLSSNPVKKDQVNTMGIFAQILALIMGLLPGTIHTIETVAGDVTAGKTKKQMATDALTGAATTAATVLTGGDAELAQLAAGAVMEGIDATDAISTAVKAAKGTPAFTAATAKGNALQAKVAALTAPKAAAPAAHDAAPVAHAPAATLHAVADPELEASADAAEEPAQTKF